MAVPKRKMSKARRDRRRANWKLSVPGMVECPQCHEMKMPHRDSRRANWKLTAPGLVECPQCHEQMRPHHVCPECGYYNGKQVIAKAE